MERAREMEKSTQSFGPWHKIVFLLEILWIASVPTFDILDNSKPNCIGLFLSAT